MNKKNKKKNHDERSGSLKEQISWVPQTENLRRRKGREHNRRNAQERRKKEVQCMVMHEHVTCKNKLHHGQKPNPNYNTHNL